MSTISSQYRTRGRERNDIAIVGALYKRLNFQKISMLNDIISIYSGCKEAIALLVVFIRKMHCNIS